MGESKAADGVVDELLLGDGFSVVDSTKTDGGADGDVKDASKVEVKEEQPEKSEDEKKEEGEEKNEPTAIVELKPNEKPEEDKKDLLKDDIPAATEDKTKTNGLDSTLYITTEEDLDLEKDKKNDVKEAEENTKENDKETKDESKGADKRKQGDVWVSNITRHIKATDLKKHFSKYGKVLTAKIVTNGKSFFGYILMETNDIANKCVRSLHGSTLDNRKITVSRQRPDQRRTVSDRSKPVVKPKIEKKSEKKPEKKPEKKAEKTDDKKKEEGKSDEKKTEDKKSAERKKEDALTAAKRSEQRVRRELEYCRREVSRLRRVLSDEQRQLRLEQSKNRSLNRDLQDAEAKLREERRKIDRDRETFDKSQRTDRLKLEADRSLIKKELEEVKKLREYLKRKLEEEARPLERRPRANSPFAYSSKRFRDSSGGDKGGSKYVEERTRTPPSPPKLSSRSKRSPINAFSMDKDRRGGTSHHYGMEREEVSRHGSGSMMLNAKPSAPAAPRNIWPSFHQEVWRMPPGGGSSTNAPFGSNQSYQNRQDYNSSSSSKPSYSSQQRDFNKRDHYSGGSIRKY